MNRSLLMNYESYFSSPSL